jgi:hypothetical protein
MLLVPNMTAASCSVILEYSADEVIVSFAATLYSFLLMSGTGSMSKAAIDQTLENLEYLHLALQKLYDVSLTLASEL